MTEHLTKIVGVARKRQARASINDEAATPNGPALRSCLVAKTKDLGPDCLSAVESVGPDRGPGSGPVARLCMHEIDKHCAGVEHGTGAVRACLEAKRSELGNACAIALDNTGPGRRR